MTANQILLNLLFALLVGATCAHLAKKRGRSSRNWFFIGAFFGIFGMFTLLFLPPIKSEKIALDLESSKTLPIEKGEEELAELWYYSDKEYTQKGPVSLFELKELFKNEEITYSSLVWCKGMKQWKPLEEIQLLASELKQ